MERQHDFRVDDFAFMGVVFLLLVALGKEPFPALVGSGSNGRLAFTPVKVKSFAPRQIQRRSFAALAITLSRKIF